MPYTIILDPGHGGNDAGASYNGRLEKDDVLNLTLAVGQILANNGYEVLYTRTDDIYESPFAKATEANESGADLFVSFHRNSNPTPNSASGVETLIYDSTGLKYYMANAINEELERVGFVNLGVKDRPNLIVLKRTKMPALLVEVGFINSEADNEFFDENFDAIAQGIADGIMNSVSTYTGERPRPIPDSNTMNQDGQNSDVMNPGGQNSGMTNPGGQNSGMTNPGGQNSGMTNPPGNMPMGPGPVMPQRPDDMAQPNRPSRPNQSQPGRPHQMTPRYRVQVGAFRRRPYAERLFDELIAQGYPADLVAGRDGYYRVQVGSYEQLEEASSMERRLKRAGYPTIIVQ